MSTRRIFAIPTIAPMLLIALCFTAPSAARAACGVDYAKLISAVMNKGFNFNGETIFFGKTIKLPTPISASGRVFEGSFARVSELEPELAETLRQLRRDSNHGAPNEREMGMLIAVYSDGSHRSVKFTSNKMDRIEPAAIHVALKRDRIMTSAVVSIIDVHTHPDIGHRSGLLFSADDIAGFLYLKKNLERAIGRDIEYQSILLPNCRDCEDAMLTAEF